MKTYLLCGLPGSGKSTYANSLYNRAIVNRDQIRIMLAGKYQNFPFGNGKMEKLVTSIAQCSAEQIIKSEKILVIDETNISRKRRKKWIDFIKSINPYIWIVGVWFNTPVDMCKKRRQNDTKNTNTNWNKVIDSMYERMQVPFASEFDDFLIIEK